MEDQRTVPFAGTPLKAGCALVAIDWDGNANVWVVDSADKDGMVTCHCPFNKTRFDSFAFNPSAKEWIGPDVQSVLAYLKLMGIEAR